MKTLALALLSTLLLAPFAVAHGNLQHVLGTVTAVTGHSISVKTADGAIQAVAFDAETHFLKGTIAATARDVVVGSRVAIHAHKDGDAMHAVEVKISAGATH